jgi:peptide/nickel transport system permease protein
MDRAGADVCPGLAILVVSLAFNALGESLRIVLDPTTRDR